MKNLTTTSTLLSTLFIVAAATGFAGSASASEGIQGYIHIPNAAISGHNRVRLYEKSPAECAQECNSRDWCVSFDYDKARRKCDLSDQSAATVGLKTNYSGNPYDYYGAPQISCGEGTELNEDSTECVSSVDITTDNQASFQAGVASVDITTDNQASFEAGVESGYRDGLAKITQEGCWVAGFCSKSNQDRRAGALTKELCVGEDLEAAWDEGALGWGWSGNFTPYKDVVNENLYHRVRNLCK